MFWHSEARPTSVESHTHYDSSSRRRILPAIQSPTQPTHQLRSETGHRDVIRSIPTITYRTPQTDMSAAKGKLVRCVYEYFKDNPYAFEPCAAEIARMMDG
jgi:hypothetical protein